MKIAKILTAFTLAAVVGNTATAAVVKAEVTVNKKTSEYYVEANAKDGKLTLSKSKTGPKQTLKRGLYKVVKVDFPSGEFRKMDSAFKGGKYDAAIVEAKRLFDKYKWLNASLKPAQVWGDSLFAQKKYNDAMVAFATAKRFLSGDELLTVMLGEAKCLQALGKNKELAVMFPKLVRRGGAAAAFVFNAQGAMAKAQKNNNDALLAYMKTFTLFSAEDDAVKSYRAEAKKEIIAIFEAMGDNRAKTFVKEK